MSPEYFPAIAAQISMREHGVTKPVSKEWVQRAVDVCLINSPVLLEFFGTENQYLVILEFKILDDGQRLESFSQADAVGKDAAVVFQDFVDRALDTILLKREKSLPYPRVHYLDVFIEQAALFLVGQKVLKTMEERFVIDECGGVVLIELAEVLEDFRFDILHEGRVIPKFVEPDL